MARPTEYPLAVPGYSKMEAGRSYVTARFALDLLSIVLPHWTAISAFYGTKFDNIIVDYGRSVQSVDLTSVFIDADRDYFAPGTHYAYLSNEGQLRQQLVYGLSYNLASIHYRQELDMFETFMGAEAVQRWFVAAAKLICRTAFRLTLCNMISVIVKPIRDGLPPQLKRVHQVSVSLTQPPR